MTTTILLKQQTKQTNEFQSEFTSHLREYFKLEKPGPKTLINI